MKYYKQTKSVSWLTTPEGTIWISTHDDYIQPEDEKLRQTPLGVDLSLIDDDSLNLFMPISTIVSMSNDNPEVLPLTFIQWYSGMKKEKIIAAYRRWLKEAIQASSSPEA